MRSFDLRSTPGCEPWPSGRGLLVVRVVLPGPATRTLPRDHDSLKEQLASPDTPGLTTLECPVEAHVLHRAVSAERLGVLHVGWRLGEPQLRVVRPARQ